MLPYCFPFRHSPLSAVEVVGSTLVVGGPNLKVRLELLKCRILTMDSVPYDTQS